MPTPVATGVNQAAHLPRKNAVLRARVIRADGTVEDLGVVSHDFRFPRDLFRFLRYLRQNGWKKRKN